MYYERRNWRGCFAVSLRKRPAWGTAKVVREAVQRQHQRTLAEREAAELQWAVGQPDRFEIAHGSPRPFLL